MKIHVLSWFSYMGNRFGKLPILFVSILYTVSIMSCVSVPKESKSISRSFYYWKTRYALTESEKNLLDSLDVHKLYVRYFDVDVSPLDHKPSPRAVVIFDEKPKAEIVPVIYLVNNTLVDMDTNSIVELAKNIVNKTNQISNSEGLQHTEWQIDCDWTLHTKKNYFLLLTTLKSLLPTSTTLSATIRLHQVKFFNKTGIPPVDRGMLMVYNVGKMGDIKTQNSIFDPNIIRQYTGELQHYPLKLDVGFPIFGQCVLFRNNKYFAVLRNENQIDPKSSRCFDYIDDNQYFCTRDTTVHDIHIRKGDRIRVEKSDNAVVRAVSRDIIGILNNKEVCLILFDLNEIHIKKQGSYENIKAVFEGH